MCTAFNQPALIQHQYPVSKPGKADSVADKDGGAAFYFLLNCVKLLHFSYRIKGCRRFVKNQDLLVAHMGS